MHKFLVVVEQANGNFSAYSPDLPGCVATGDTRAEAEKEMNEAIAFHLEGLREDGTEIPKASSSAGYVVVKSDTVLMERVGTTRAVMKKRKEISTKIRRRASKHTGKTKTRKLTRS